MSPRFQKKRDYQKNPIDLTKVTIPREINHGEPDEWQNQVLDYWGNIAICSGRQVGKSAVMALKVAIAACKYPDIHILISSGSERQANYLYEKIKISLKMINEDVIAGTPTMRLTKLKNGTEIYCLPTGHTGDLIRGLTLDVWIPDEAAYINDAVWATITPMLWVSMQQKGMGWIWALSTPAGKIGRFYECFQDPRFRKWRISAVDCSRIPSTELERWKSSYSKVQYAQEVLGEFVDEVSRLFPDTLLKAHFKKDIGNLIGNKFLGVDVARYGGDENAFVTAIENNNKYKVPLAITTSRVGINETYKKVEELEKENNYKKILVDDAGVGGGLTDFLIEKFNTKIIGVNNAQRAINKDKTKSRRLLKEDLYSNAIMLMEQGLVTIEEQEDLYNSLASMLYEYNENGKVRIFGRNSHLAEAFVRALWGAKKKSLNLWATSASQVNKW